MQIVIFIILLFCHFKWENKQKVYVEKNIQFVNTFSTRWRYKLVLLCRFL